VTSLFAYGTLEIPALMEAVTGRRLPEREGVVRGFERRRLRRRPYPAAIPAEGAELPGRVYEGIDAATLARLDRFEGALYERRRVSAETAGGVRLEAELYVLAPGHGGELLPEPWERDTFVARHLAEWLARCNAFRAAEEARAPGPRP
jgi:gamma-glutamylcyclotransferase (GGCT)/AIG2-like uncharacterized protein YtfP